MSGTVSRKRRGDDLSNNRPLKGNDRIQKKRKRQQHQQPNYGSASDSSEDDRGDLKTLNETTGEDDSFQAVDLLDSDDEGLDQLADDGATSEEYESGAEDGSEDDLDSLDDENEVEDDKEPASMPKKKLPQPLRKTKILHAARDAPTDDENAAEDASEAFSDDEKSGDESSTRPKSKRNDPATFATSLSKILGTKLSSSRRADPVLARSTEAHEASRRVVDAQLEEKARRQMRLEKRAAMEKGRVKDVLVATNKEATSGDDDGNIAETTATILTAERRLRKVAQRGVVQLFNAVRAAQTKAALAQKQAKSEGLLGMDKRSARVTEMSRKGFLDLIASGGGGLKKGGLEEA
ncbi:pre-60S ribosomal particles component [Sporothrix epigloea]|uniref:Pre-60S ribosomal particles component n=1 Tax=Sporothrix epigloea TaxID=1892477 RepID=A0ABP0DL39_9PEZI